MTKDQREAKRLGKKIAATIKKMRFEIAKMELAAIAFERTARLALLGRPMGGAR